MMNGAITGLLPNVCATTLAKPCRALTLYGVRRSLGAQIISVIF
jgi:hypothetical protein